MTYQEASALVKAEREKRKGLESRLTVHDWQTIGHRLIDVDTRKPRADAFLKGHLDG